MLTEFYLRHTFQHPFLHICKELVSNKEISTLLSQVDYESLFDAKIYDQSDEGRIDKKQRVSKNFLLKPRGPIFKKMKNFALEVNKKYWSFPGPFIYPNLQFASYGFGGHFNWHHDVHDSNKNTRIITALMLLNEPSSFSGGEFEIRDFDGKISKLKLKKGQVFVFPANFYHRVQKVVSGQRQTLGLSILTRSSGQ